MSEQVIKLSDSAAERIKQIMSQAENSAIGVRIGVKSGGCAGMSYVMEYANEIKSKPNVMMVTILTALNDSDLKDMGNNNTADEQVGKLAKVAKETGVGVVCSGHEAKIVRKIIGQNLLIFTPICCNFFSIFSYPLSRW